jgi:copper chaperone CopZ
MKNLKTLALVALTAITMFSCKNEATNTETKAENNTTEIAAADLTTTTFKIEGMTCAMGCAKTIENKLAGLNGVGEAVVDFETETATVKFDASKLTTENIVSTVEAVAGGDIYKVADVKTSSNKAMLDQEKKKGCCSSASKNSKSCSSESKTDKKCCSADKKTETKKESSKI